MPQWEVISERKQDYEVQLQFHLNLLGCFLQIMFSYNVNELRFGQSLSSFIFSKFYYNVLKVGTIIIWRA